MRKISYPQGLPLPLLPPLPLLAEEEDEIELPEDEEESEDELSELLTELLDSEPELPLLPCGTVKNPSPAKKDVSLPGCPGRTPLSEDAVTNTVVGEKNTPLGDGTVTEHCVALIAVTFQPFGILLVARTIGGDASNSITHVIV